MGENNNPAVIRRNMLWNVIGSMGFVGAQWAMTILIVHLAGYNEAGHLSLGLSLTNVFTNIIYFGIRNFQVSDTSGRYSDRDYCIHRLIMAVSALIVFCIFVFAAGYRGYVAVFLIAFMVYRGAEPVVDVFHGIDQRAWRLDIAGRSFLIRGLMGLIAFVAVEWLTGNLLYTTIAMVAVVYPVLIFYDIPMAEKVSRTGFLARTTGDGWALRMKSLTLECLPLFVYAICLNSVVPIPRYVLERVAGTEALGYYSSVAIPASIIQLLSSYLFTTFTGLFSDYKKEGRSGEFAKLAVKLALAIILMCSAAAGACRIPVGWLFGAKDQELGEWALRLLFTDAISAYTYLLIPAIGSCGVIAMVWFLGMLLTVLRDRRGLLIGAAMGTLVATVIAYPMIEVMGASGVNAVVAVSSAVTLIIFTARLMKGLGQMRIATAGNNKY